MVCHNHPIASHPAGMGQAMNRHPSVISTQAPSAPETIPYENDPVLVAKARKAIAGLRTNGGDRTVPGATDPLAEIELDISKWFIENGDAA
jgi:hypothetical protein